MPRRRKKIGRKFLGTRHHGKGNTKNARGKGCRGGVGMAGSHKHKWTYIVKYEPKHFGLQGFSPVRRKKVRSMNLYEIDQLAEKGVIPEKEGRREFEFDGKILGCGEITFPIVVKAVSFSKKASEKIKKMGGEAIVKEKKEKKVEKKEEKREEEKPAEKPVERKEEKKEEEKKEVKPAEKPEKKIEEKKKEAAQAEKKEEKGAKEEMKEGV